MGGNFVRSPLFVCTVLGSVLLGGALQTPVRAQSVTVASRAEHRPAGRLVSVNVTDAPLKQVLQEIARQAGLDPVYGGAVARTDTRVTLRVRDVPAEEAFERALAGTRLTASIVARSVVFELANGTAMQVQGSVSGKVVNAKTKQPIAGATVFLDAQAKGVQTDNEGAFRVPASTGEHQLTVRAVGFVRQTRQIIVQERSDAIVVALEPSASVLDEVVVTGTVVATERKAIATPITVITAEDIERRGVTRIDQLLRGEVPGVVALDWGTSNYGATLEKMQSSVIYSRGSSSLEGNPNPMKTYVDGVELLDPQYLGTIDPRTIERIEIITGPQAATIYGSGAMGGVMQIFTKKGSAGRAPEVTASLRYGVMQSNLSNGYTPSHNDALLVTGSDGPGFSYSATLSYLYSGQWQPALFSRSYGVQLGMTRTQGPFTASASIATTAGENGTGGGSQYSGVGYIVSERNWHETGEWYASSLGYFFMRQRANSSAQTSGLNVDYRATSFWQHHLTLGKVTNKFALDPTAPNYGATTDTLARVEQSNGDRSTLSYSTTLTPARLGPMSTTLTLGANGSWGDQSRFTGYLTSATASSFVNTTVSKTIDQESWGGFGSWQLGFFDRLYFTLGLRAERNPAYGSEHKIDWTPTNGVAYTIEQGDLTVKLLGSYGKATRAPLASYREAVDVVSSAFIPQVRPYQIASPGLRPEYSRGPQGGIELYYGNWGSLTVNRYMQKVTDLIQWIVVDSITVFQVSTGTDRKLGVRQYLNAATIRASGWEGTASLNVGVLSVKGTYSWNDSRVLSVNPQALYSPLVGSMFDRVPTHTGNIIVTYARGGTSASLTTNYIGSQSLYNNQNFLGLSTAYSRLLMYYDRVTSWPGTWPLAGYTKSDLAVSHRLTRSATALLNIVNLGNRTESDAGDLYPTLGRQTQIGVSLRFP